MTVRKKDYIQGLPKVKLILGNGFDLHCKLHSSYYDYFFLHKLNKYKYEFIHSFFEKYRSIYNAGTRFYEPNLIGKNELKKLNVWDYFFTLYNYYCHTQSEDENWSNIEELILESLTGNESKKSPISWSDVYRVINNHARASDFILESMVYVVYSFNDKHGFEKEIDFYNFLLSQLKLFEKEFGYFIKNQRVNLSDKSFLIGMKNERYFDIASRTLKHLCNLDKVVSIDVFNYDSINLDETIQKERCINGDFDNPIFGIDSSILPSKPQYIFTKTNRKIEHDLINRHHEVESPFENVVVYGHSLDKADYNYFFPILDKLELIDNTKTGVIVFAYSIYDDEKKEEILRQLRLSIYSLFLQYGKYKGLTEPNRLIDILASNRRIIMFEIINIEYDETYFDKAFSK